MATTTGARPYFAVDFTADRKLAQAAPSSVMVKQKEYNHDTVLLKYTDAGIARRRYRKGAPVVVRWGWAPKDIETFYGYVHSSKLIKPPGGGRMHLEVYLVSASYRMNKTWQRSHTNLNVVPLIRRIASEHHFNLRNDPSSRFHRHIPQLGRSDFKLMCDLARDIGFTLHVKRTEVQFKRRVIDTSAKGRQPSFRYAGGYGPPKGTLFSFVQRAGSAPLAQNRRLVIGGVDANGKPFWATDPTEECCEAGDEPLFTEYWMDDAPASIHEGRELLSGLSGLNRFYVQASLEVSGSPKLRCGQTLRLTNVGEELLGYWWTGSVEHVLDGPIGGRPTRYRCRVEVGRESLLQTQCVTGEPPTSFSDKPEVIDPCGVPLDEVVQPEVPTVFSPADDCPPLEEPAKPPCKCPPKKCPGSTTPLRSSVTLKPRVDRWGAVVAPRKAPRPILIGRR